MIVQYDRKRKNKNNGNNHIKANLINLHIKKHFSKVTKLINLFNGLVDKRLDLIRLIGTEDAVNNNITAEKEITTKQNRKSIYIKQEVTGLLLTKLNRTDTWENKLRNRIEEYYDLKIISTIERDLILAKDQYERSLEEIDYSRISIVRVIRNLNSKIAERKEFIKQFKSSFVMSQDVNDASTIQIIRKSKLRYKSILRETLSIINSFGLKFNGDYVEFINYSEIVD